MKKRIVVVSTGGTIEKTYDEISGFLDNQISVLDVLLGSLEFKGIDLSRIAVMNKDSLNMEESDHHLIAATAGRLAEIYDGVVVVHGTDRLQYSGEATYEMNPDLKSPVVFTGAMRPYELRSTDSVQNVTESLLAIQLLPAGVYTVFHNQVLQFPGVVKDYQHLKFTKENPPSTNKEESE